ncbi:uncharacterized protein LOC142358351, partial [Convolutriloba macropyga]|uniref:uncharacterized protein LOC142358351 n=1 Tax=Convolutriloba macropyga TaxID=536237 RepID=UPI003F51AD44
MSPIPMRKTNLGNSAKESVRKCGFPHISVNHRLFRSHVIPYVSSCSEVQDCTGEIHSRVFFADNRYTFLLWTCHLGQCRLRDCRKDDKLLTPIQQFNVIKNYIKFNCNWDRSLARELDLEGIRMEYLTLRENFAGRQITYRSQLGIYFDVAKGFAIIATSSETSGSRLRGPNSRRSTSVRSATEMNEGGRMRE